MQVSDEESEQNDKVLTSSTVDSWCQQITNQHSISVLPNLLNGFRAACYYGSGSPDGTAYMFQTKVAFCKILCFVLHQSDCIFRRLMGMSNSGCKKDTVLELQGTSKWTSVKPLVKSYFKSTFYLLTQVADTQIISFILSRLKDSVSFLVPFPELQRKLSKVNVKLQKLSEISCLLCVCASTNTKAFMFCMLSPQMRVHSCLCGHFCFFWIGLP